MQEKSIVKISYITAIIGLGLLFVFSEVLKPAIADDLDSAKTAEEVRILGKITRVQNSEKALFLEIEGQKTVKTEVILFPEEKIFVNEGDYAEITGTVEEYQGKKEIVASRIVLK